MVNHDSQDHRLTSKRTQSHRTWLGPIFNHQAMMFLLASLYVRKGFRNNQSLKENQYLLVQALGKVWSSPHAGQTAPGTARASKSLRCSDSPPGSLSRSLIRSMTILKML